MTKPAKTVAEPESNPQKVAGDGSLAIQIAGYRDALYDHLTAKGVSHATTETIAQEAALYVSGYEIYKVHGIEVSAKEMGFSEPGYPEDWGDD